MPSPFQISLALRLSVVLRPAETAEWMTCTFCCRERSKNTSHRPSSSRGLSRLNVESVSFQARARAPGGRLIFAPLIVCSANRKRLHIIGLIERQVARQESRPR